MAVYVKTLPSLLHSGVADPIGDACLSDDDIIAFVQGELPHNVLESFHGHLDHCQLCQQLLAEAAHAISAEPCPESTGATWNAVFRANTVVANRYRIRRLIARGGMGEVYEAYDTTLHDRVALKTVTSIACDSVRAVRQLRAEVQLARRITHPNVCRIYDLGTHVVESTGFEISFLAMEFIHGECLGAKLRHGGALPLDLALSVASQLLMGLHAAHHAGILHRDFKSDNVMLRTEADGQISAVILDFGLARVLNDRGLMATADSMDQAMVGTVAYMAPEQIDGESLSRASDLYAFGVVWFEMLTGRLPFEAETATAMAMARMYKDPVAPSQFNAAIPRWLDLIVLRCLHRERSARYASALEVLDSLTHAMPTPESRQVETKRPRRSPRWLAEGVLLASALLGFVGFGFLPRQPPMPSCAQLVRIEWPAIPPLHVLYPKVPIVLRPPFTPPVRRTRAAPPNTAPIPTTIVDEPADPDPDGGLQPSAPAPKPKPPSLLRPDFGSKRDASSPRRPTISNATEAKIARQVVGNGDN